MKFLFITILLSVILVAPAMASEPSSSVQVQGILSSIEDQQLAQRDVYWHRGDYPRIIALDRIVTAGDPHELECYETGGWLMDSLGDEKDAEAYYRSGVTHNPKTEDLYFHLGFFYFSSLHDYKQAANAFKLASEQRDAGINDWKMLAHSYEQAHEYRSAVQTWWQIKARWPHGLLVDQNLKRAQGMLQTSQPGANVL